MNEKEHRQAVGRRLANRRRERGLTQQQLADVSGVSRPSISNMESGTQGVTLFMAVKITRALGVSIDELAGCL